MGNKVNPISHRLGYIRPSDATWYAQKQTEYATNVVEDEMIRGMVPKYVKDETLSNILIARDAKYVTLTLCSSKPGMIIGPGGARVAELTENFKQELVRFHKLQGKGTQPKELQLNVYEVKRPDLDAPVVAKSIAAQIANRVSYRRAVRQAINNVMRASAKGIKVQVAGRLSGAEIARSESYKEGRVPLSTLRADVDYYQAEAHTVYGKIGVKVWIFLGEVYGKRDLTVRIDPTAKGSKRPPRSPRK